MHVLCYNVIKTGLQARYEQRKGDFENYTIYDYLGLFFLYAFLGWLLETTVAAVRKKHMVNRGFLNGPLCAIYGITAVFMTRYLYELQSSPVFLFLGCMIIATAAEWIAGHVLERIGHGKWWDYSNKKWNMDGYICLQYSVLWGILGVLALKFGNILGLTLLHLAQRVMHITLWILFGVLVVDAIGSYAVLRHITKKMPRIAAMNDQIDAFTKRLSVRLYRYLEARVERAYPSVQPIPKQKEKSEVFAEGCSFYKIILLFIIGAFLGDIVETIFCRITAGVWMSAAALSGVRSASSGASPSPSPPGSSIITETAPMAFYSPSEPSSAVPTNTSAAFSPKSSSEKFSGTTATFPSTSAAASTSCTASSGESPPSYG